MNRKVLIILFALLIAGLALHQARRAAPTPSTNSPATAPSAFLRPPGTRTAVGASARSAEPQGDKVPYTNLFTRIMAGEKIPPLTLEQVAPYLDANRRNAESLIAAYIVTGSEKALLEEAKQKYPNDPRVAYFAAVRADSPEDRQQWLKAFKQSAPDNPLPNYLSALDHFKNNQIGEAMQDLTVAAAQPKYQDYSAEFVQNDTEAYLAAGYSEADAKVQASASLILPQLAQLKQLGVNLADSAKSSLQAGDAASAQALVQAGLTLGQRLEEPGGGNVLITDLVGIAVERLALGALDPATPYGNSGQTVQDQIDQALGRRDAIKSLSQQFEAVVPTLSDQDLIGYLDRQKISGEMAAERWVLAKYATK